MKRYFLINPIAGNGKALDYEKKIEIACQNMHISENLDYQIIISKSEEHLQDFANALALKAEEKVIYSVGGDGTNFLVANAVMKANSNTNVSFIPGGSGNDLCRSLEQRPELEYMDLGQVNDLFFTNVLSFGLDVEALKIAEERLRNGKSATNAYNTGIIQAILKNKTTLLSTKDKSQEVTLIAIANGKYYGNGKPIAPFARLDDGFFDVITVNKLPLPLLLYELARLIKRKHLNDKRFVQSALKNKFRIHSEQNIHCNIDGQMIQGNTFDIQIKSKALKLLSRTKDPLIKQL